MEKIRVVIADDHPLIREGLRRVLELDENIEIAGEVGDGQGAINLARSLRPDIILMDLKMPGTSGKEASRVIRREMPDIKIIILTVAEDEEMLEVIKAGASGYLLKDVEPAELMKSIYDVLEGRPAFHPVVTGRLLGEYNRLSTATAKEEGISALTEREKEVLSLIAMGEPNRGIARILFISEKTVKNHITSIFRKIKVTDRTQAAIYAIKNNLVEL
ncbi:response regulator [Syntrophaceticus schinkii]|jgi:DNA-binding NarL/FixJ family response regulator|uniref:Stage 0 sporulation protein A homolog n=1 Tax=Syntrophaceticus schinkii TaxID=499207 RepID=A0A0B7ME95_9FIRM|nr:response regulator transcription factor [Syntrophaceticus schinkii]MDD4262489.1 response regulator transcription factor [Syntrophaceticus schinkii]CEO88385.1 Transcriptional regulatory protein DegU [Syntrophaceticus schinkii]